MDDWPVPQPCAHNLKAHSRPLPRLGLAPSPSPSPSPAAAAAGAGCGTESTLLLSFGPRVSFMSGVFPSAPAVPTVPRPARSRSKKLGPRRAWPRAFGPPRLSEFRLGPWETGAAAAESVPSVPLACRRKLFLRLGVCVFPSRRRPVALLVAVAVGVPGGGAGGLPFDIGCADRVPDPDPGHEVEGGAFVSEMVSDMGGGSEGFGVPPLREGAGRLAGGFRTDGLGVSSSRSEVSMASLPLSSSSSLDVPSPNVRLLFRLTSAHFAAFFLPDFRTSALLVLAGFAEVRGCECTIATVNRHEMGRRPFDQQLHDVMAIGETITGYLIFQQGQTLTRQTSTC